MVSTKRKFLLTDSDILKDIVLWGIAGVLFCGAVFWGLYHQISSKLIKVLINVFVILLLFLCIRFTTHGRRFFNFFRSSVTELQKVVWPSRDETFKTTFVISLLVFVSSVILWLIDFCLIKIIYLFTK